MEAMRLEGIRLLFPALALAAGLAVSVGSFFFVRENVERDAKLRFERQASDAGHVIEARIASYFEVLHGLAALFARPRPVSRAEFHDYVTALDLGRRYPGFTVLNYAEHVTLAGRAEFEARVRRDTSLDAQGYPAFSIKPPGERAEYLVISYLSPIVSGQTVFGRDIMFDPGIGSLKDRIEAMNRARDSGEMMSSGRLIDVRDGGPPALAMRLPLYRAGPPPQTVAERRARYLGSVGAGFRLQELMRGALDDAALRFMRFSFYDGGPAHSYVAREGALDPDRLLFDSKDLVPPAGGGHDGDAFVRVMIPMETAGRIWEVRFSAPREALVHRIDRALPWLFLGGGLLASLLLSQIIYSLAASRSRAMRSAADLRFASTHDPLTGLANRTLFHEQTTHALSRAARYRRGVAVLFLDLDRFKTVNDTLGHAAGDALLRECARRLKDSLRESDTVARISGDEFAVVMEDYMGARDAVTVAQKILANLGVPVRLEGEEFTPSASIGISVYPEDGTTLEVLLKNADIAMYRAKAHGRNNHQFYSTSSNQQASERLVLEASLRTALEREELLLEFQPRIDLATTAIAGVEALVRWRHPEFGLLASAKFMPLAEETGLSAAIGAWALRRAAEQSRQWREERLPAGRVAVNIAANQFARKDFLGEVGTLLGAALAPPECMEFELTESMLMKNPERTTQILRSLAGMGIAIAIDDFGSGYSSLAYLQSLPLAAIKIDAAFVKSVPEDPNGAAIAQGVIALGHSLGLAVVAQGVDNAQQEEFLIANGCEQAQGNRLCAPLSAQEMTAFLRRHTERRRGQPFAVKA